MSLANYFIISNLSLLVFYAVYYFTLRKETHFQLNRAYLLFVLLFSVLLPFIQLPGNSSFEQIGIPTIELSTITISPMETSSNFNWQEILFYIYIALGSIILLRFLISMGSILLLILKNQVEKKGNYTLVKTDKSGIFSFFHYLFWNDDLADDQSAPKILAHEQTHIRQWHSIDIVLIEIAKVAFWFNPVLWAIHKDIRLNHEYLADAAACPSEQKSFKEYSNILLAHVFNISPSSLENNFFNHSLTQKRLAMLTQKKSLGITKWKYLWAIPAIFMGLYFASCSQETEEVEKEVRVEKSLDEIMESNEVEEPPRFPGGSKAMIQYIIDNLEYPASAKAEGTEGTTFVKFQIDQTGSVVSAEVEKGFDEACDKAAVEVVRNMPNWEMPDLEANEEIKIELVLPVKFVLAEDTK